MAQPTLSQIVALLHFDAANDATSFVEEKGATVTLQGGSFISTARSAFGSASSRHIVSNGGGAYFTNTDLNGWTGDFTAEAFVWVAESSDRRTIIGLNNTESGGNLCINAGLLEWYPAGGSGAFTHQTSVSLFAFHHVALVRYGGVISLYLDGVKSSGSHSTSASLFNSSLIWVGGVDSGQVMAGFVDEVRITKNAVYTANFTVPTSAFSLPSEATGVEMSGSYSVGGSLIGSVGVAAVMSGDYTIGGLMFVEHTVPGGANITMSGQYTLDGLMSATYTPAAVDAEMSGAYALSGLAQITVGDPGAYVWSAMSGAYKLSGALRAAVWRPVKDMGKVTGKVSYKLGGSMASAVGCSVVFGATYQLVSPSKITYPFVDADSRIRVRERVTGVVQ